MWRRRHKQRRLARPGASGRKGRRQGRPCGMIPLLPQRRSLDKVKTASLGAVCRGPAADPVPVDPGHGNLTSLVASDLLVEAARASGWEVPGQSEPHVDPHEQGSFPPELVALPTQQRLGTGPGEKKFEQPSQREAND